MGKRLFMVVGFVLSACLAATARAQEVTNDVTVCTLDGTLGRFELFFTGVFSFDAVLRDCTVSACDDVALTLRGNFVSLGIVATGACEISNPVVDFGADVEVFGAEGDCDFANSLERRAFTGA